MLLRGFAAGIVVLALNVELGDLNIAQGHADIFMAEHSHQGRKANAETDHLRSEAMPQLVELDWQRTAS